jgi:hypothetical protein
LDETEELTMTATATQHQEFGLARGDDSRASNGGGNMQIATTRSAQEVQAAMVVAKRFPRDEMAAFGRIMQSCKRKTLAEQALYAYPRGNTTVTGPSIRLAEAMAQSWGNIDFGIIELEQKNGESSVMAYAWDLETNTRQTKIFTIKHERHTRQGTKTLTDPRDIYELAANQGARRLRACILGIIPGDVIDQALDQCEKTLTGGNQEPLVDRIRKMVTVFSEMGVTQEMLEKRMGHKVDASTEIELVNLRKIYKSLQDNMASVADFFDQSATKARTSDIGERIDKLKTVTPTQPEPPSSDAPPPEAPESMAADPSQSAAAEVELSTEESMDAVKAYAKLESLAASLEIPPSQFEAAIKKACQTRGGFKKVAPAFRRDLFCAMRDGTFDLDAGSIRQ